MLVGLFVGGYVGDDFKLCVELTLFYSKDVKDAMINVPPYCKHSGEKWFMELNSLR